MKTESVSEPTLWAEIDVIGSGARSVQKQPHRKARAWWCGGARRYGPPVPRRRALHMDRFSRFAMLAAVSLAASIAAADSASAGGFAIREQSATAQGYSYVGAASGAGGPSSMFWNPATITMLPGWQNQWNASVIMPRSEIDPLPPTPTLPFGGSGDIAQDAIVPTSYLS